MINMAIKIQTQTLEIPVEFEKENGEKLTINFDASDENVKRIVYGEQSIKEDVRAKLELIDSDDNFEHSEAVVRELYTYLFGEDVFDEVYEFIGSLTKCLEYYDAIIAGLGPEIDALGLDPEKNQALGKYLKEDINKNKKKSTKKRKNGKK